MMASQLRGSARLLGASIQTYARIAGALFLVSIVAGGFGESYAPSQLIVAGNANATAQNLIAHDVLYRLGFLAYLTEAVCDVALTFLLYILLRPVHAPLAFLAVLFRMMATATFAFAELFYFIPSLLVGGDVYLKTFSPDQLNTLALLSLNVYETGGFLFVLFYGIGSILLGSLMMRSGYLPWILGALLALGGLGFVIRNVLVVLTPAYASLFLVLPMILTLLLLGPWLLIRGVNVEKWNEKEAAAYGSVPG
jgi:hypothetical protein